MRYLLSNRFDIIDGLIFTVIVLSFQFGWAFLGLPIALICLVLKDVNKQRVLNDFTKIEQLKISTFEKQIKSK